MWARAVFNAGEGFRQLRYVTLEGGVKELPFDGCVNGGCQDPCGSVVVALCEAWRIWVW